MSKNVRFVLNLPGLNALMKSGELQSILNSAAGAIASNAGEGYEARPAKPISFVAIASVGAATYKARRDNNRNNTLLKATGGVKL